jgi:hypothetical protein
MKASRPIPPWRGRADRSAATVRAWVGLYTWRLPPGVAASRRALIESDLWDESQAADVLGETGALGRQRVSRLIRGVPADLTWRLGHSRARKGAARRDSMRISRMETMVLASVGAVYGVGLIAILLMLTRIDPENWGGWGPYGLAAALALSVAGLILAVPRPVIGLGLAVAGTLIAVFAMPWAWFLLLPVPLAALYRLGRSRTTGPGPMSAHEGSTSTVGR